MGTQSCFPPHYDTFVRVGEVRYLSITDGSRTVRPPGLPDLSAGLPDLSAGLVLWPFLVVFGADTAATSCISAWSQSYVLPCCHPDLWSSAPGGWSPAPTPVPAFQPPPGAAHRAEPALRSGYQSTFFRLPNMPVLCTLFSRHGPCVYTFRGNIPAWVRTQIYPLGP